jgi:hypothetical protein
MGNDAPGAVTLLPKADAFSVALPSLFWKRMPALPQFVIELFWITLPFPPTSLSHLALIHPSAWRQFLYEVR